MKFDCEDMCLLWVCRVTGLSVDRVYGWSVVRFFMSLLAKSGGSSVKRPR